MAYLGKAYLTGILSTHNEAPTLSVKWLTLAAKNGHPEAQFLLGTLYASGKGVNEAPEEAIYWWKEAVEREYADAQLVMGKMYFDGGDGYFFKKIEYQLDDTQAAELFRKSAMQGNPDGQLMLMRLYTEGRGVPYDLEEAYFWFFILERDNDFSQSADFKKTLAFLQKSLPKERIAKLRKRAKEWKPISLSKNAYRPVPERDWKARFYKKLKAVQRAIAE